MRLLAVVTLTVLVAGATARADDKPEDRAKAAAESFLKALKAKDVPAALKAADVPFLLPDLKAKEPKLVRVEKVDAVAATLKLVVEEKGGPAAVGKIQSLADLRKKIGDGEEGKNPMVKAIFEAGGDGGFLVSLVDETKGPAGMLLVRVKGESAKVVGIVPSAGPAKKE